jgi:DNA-binding MarR family transcriptional regulator
VNHPHLPSGPCRGDEIDPRTARVFHAFRRVTQLQRQLMLKSMSEKGGHHGEAFCLRVLATKDGIAQRDLAEMLHLSRPRVTKMLQSMEAAGVVRRRSDTSDQRLTRVYITDEGRRRERDLHAAWADHMDHTIGTLSEWERDTLARLLDKISDRTEEMLGDGEEGAE